MCVNPAIVSAITALVAVVVGPIVTLYVAKRQINASVLSGNRQAWINRLRDEVASLTAIVNNLPSAHANESVATTDAIAEHGRLVKMAQTVKLLINPTEEDHKKLVQLIDTAGEEVIDSINKRKADAKHFEQVAQEIVRQTQLILKREWERVKNGS